MTSMYIRKVAKRLQHRRLYTKLAKISLILFEVGVRLQTVRRSDCGNLVIEFCAGLQGGRLNFSLNVSNGGRFLLFQ